MSKTDSTDPWSVTSEVQTSHPFQGWSASDLNKTRSKKERRRNTGRENREVVQNLVVLSLGASAALHKIQGYGGVQFTWKSSTSPSDATDTCERSFWNYVTRESTTVHSTGCHSCSSVCTFQFLLTCFLKSSAPMSPLRCDFDFGITP